MNHLNFTDSDPRQVATDADVEWKCEFDAWTSRLRARQMALKSAAAGPAPYVVLISVGVLLGLGLGPLRDLIALLLVWFSTIALAGAYVAIVGYGSAWVAHHFAYDTTVPVERLTRCLVWTANLTLWGWGLVGLLSTL